MDLKTHNIDHEDFMGKNLDLNPQQDTGFVENWGTAIGLAIDEELSISSVINSPEFNPRNEELYRLAKEGAITNSDAFKKGNSASYVEYDWNGLAREAQKQGFDIKTDTEMLGDIRNELANRRRYAQGIMEKANGWGIAGQFAGYLNAGAVDPVNAGAAILGPVAIAKYIGNISSVRRLMMAEGALGVASEGAIAPLVHEWKETLGVDYTLEDALINMGAAGLLNAGIGGLAGKLGQIIRQAEEDGIDVTPLKFHKEELERAAEVEEWSDMSVEDFFRRQDELEKEINEVKLPESTIDEDIDLDLDLDESFIPPDGVPADAVPAKELVDEVKDFLKEVGEDMEIYISTEDGITKVKAADANAALDNRIKDVDDEMGVPICGE